MSAVEHLRAIGRGETPTDDGLLGNAICCWGQGELIGAEAILAAFCSQPFQEEEAVVVETAQGAALVGASDALIADCYSGRIGRLWRVGKDISLPHEPAIDLAFDPDMNQRRGNLFVRIEDHPDLEADCVDALLEAARRHLETVRRAGALRVRAFVVRAFGGEGGAAALLAIHKMSNEPSRSAGFNYAVVAITPKEGDRFVSDDGLPRPWTPRF